MKIGIDLGGTKTEGILIDNKIVIDRIRNKTPTKNYKDLIDNISNIINNFKKKLQKNQKYSVGICIPGSINPFDNKVRNSNTLIINGKEIKKDIETLLCHKVKIENDANCFTIAESIFGAGKKYSCTFGVILGTGCGGGIYINNYLHKGRNLIAGEWGHNSLPFPTKEEVPGNQCFCGKFGCIETWISGGGLESLFFEEFKYKKTAFEIFEENNKKYVDFKNKFFSRLARSLASVINLYDPEVIILGGGLSNINQIYKSVPIIWSKYIFSNFVKTRLLKNELGDSSGVFGAAYL